MPGAFPLHARARARGHVLLALAAAGVLSCKEATPPVPVAGIEGLPAIDSIFVGQSKQLTIRALDADGRPLNRRISYASEFPSVATVSDEGVLTGVSVGTTLITASVEGKTTQSLLQVQHRVNSVIVTPTSFSLPVGGTRQLTVTTNAADGQPLPNRRVTYLSSDVSVATVTTTGLVAAVALGSATITATSEEKSGTAVVQVVQVPVASISISPPGPQTVNQGSALQLQATTRDGNGVILTGRTVNWSSSNSAIASVSGSGVVTGNALGNTQITAESEGVTTSTQVSVTPRPVATVSLSPNPGTVAVGSQLQITADLRDANGNPLTFEGRSVNWSSSNQPVASVSGSGVVTGHSVGSATITLTVDGRQATAAVNVVPAPNP